MEVSASGEERPMVTHWPERPWWRPAVRFAAVVGPLATCVVLATVRSSVASATSVLVLVVWVVAAAATGDRVAGVLAAVSGALWFDFFLTEPYLRFTISKSGDVEVTLLLVLISLAVTEVALWGYRQQAQAARRSGYLDGVLSAARAVAEGDLPTAAVVDVVARHIAEVLDADDCHFEEGAVHDPRVAVLDHDGVLTREGHPVDVERVGLPAHEYVAVLVHRGSRVVGHFLVTATTHMTYPDREQRRIAVLLADQVAAAVHSEPA
jgi:K+-sensing histidine kinase KdpD